MTLLRNGVIFFLCLSLLYVNNNKQKTIKFQFEIKNKIKITNYNVFYIFILHLFNNQID
jgi:hypothetical protein